MEEDILNYLYQLSCFVGHPVAKVYEIRLQIRKVEFVAGAQFSSVQQ